jgi:hypothetical protein
MTLQTRATAEVSNMLSRQIFGSIGLAVLAALLIDPPVFPQRAQTQPTQEPAYACSIKVPAGTPDSGVQGLAKITEAKAKDAALAAVSGTVLRSKIENENGCAVYGVEIRTADQKVHDIKVDAGTGVVLHDEVGTQAGAENEGPNEVENGTED